jgi:hypothetical protein
MREHVKVGTSRVSTSVSTSVHSGQSLNALCLVILKGHSQTSAVSHMVASGWCRDGRSDSTLKHLMYLKLAKQPSVKLGGASTS